MFHVDVYELDKTHKIGFDFKYVTVVKGYYQFHKVKCNYGHRPLYEGDVLIGFVNGDRDKNYFTPCRDCFEYIWEQSHFFIMTFLKYEDGSSFILYYNTETKYLKIGCEGHHITEWLEKYEEIAESHGFNEEETEEYHGYILDFSEKDLIDGCIICSCDGCDHFYDSDCHHDYKTEKWIFDGQRCSYSTTKRFN